MVGGADRLVAGFRGFRARHYGRRPERMRELARGQSPDAMVIACSDSRVDPALLLGAEPGDLFVVRNVANLVPPRGAAAARHGVGAALEFAVRELAVGRIIVLGHSSCGGIAALRAARSGAPDRHEFILPWMRLAADACPRGADGGIPAQAAVEQESIRISLGNLRTFPWIEERAAAGALELHGWWFDLDAGRLCAVGPHADGLRDLAAGEAAGDAAD